MIGNGESFVGLSLYEIGDFKFPPPLLDLFAESDSRRLALNADFDFAERERDRLLFGEITCVSYTRVGDFDVIRESDPILRSPEFVRHYRLWKRLEHEFRRELECPLATRHLSKEAFHVYLHLAQEEARAAQGRAFSFTLINNFANRSNLLPALRRAGFRVYGTIGYSLSDSGHWLRHMHGLAVVKGDAPDPRALEKIRKVLGPETFAERIHPAYKVPGGRQKRKIGLFGDGVSRLLRVHGAEL